MNPVSGTNIIWNMIQFMIHEPVQHIWKTWIILWTGASREKERTYGKSYEDKFCADIYRGIQFITNVFVTLSTK